MCTAATMIVHPLTVYTFIFVIAFVLRTSEARQFHQHHDYSAYRSSQSKQVTTAREEQSDSTEFNPELFGGKRTNPGLKVRLNEAGFLFAGTILGDFVDKEIRTARLPPVRQCIPQLNGCITVYNMYMSRYRCAQRVIVYPSPPNRINIAVENFDIGIAGNLGGQIVVLLPVALSGIVYLNAHQLSIILQIDVVPSPSGAPSIRVSGCSANVGYVDTFVQNAGLVGDIVNDQFRGKVSEKLRTMLPKKLCEIVPRMVNQKVNRKLSELPMNVEMFKIQSLVKKILGDTSEIPLHCFSQDCQNYLKNTTSSRKLMLAVQRREVPQVLSPLPEIKHSQRSKRSALTYYNEAPQATAIRYRQNPLSFGRNRVVHAYGASQAQPSCKGCPDAAIIKDPFQAAQALMKSFDASKIMDISLSTQLISTYATLNDFTININGVFSPRYIGVPFGAFPINFPKPIGDRMAELLLSDFTLNSLLYSLHRKNFFKFRIGPETPKIGPLLKTTCADDEEGDELEDHGVELDEEGSSTLASSLSRSSRQKRQASDGEEEESGLGDLGICFGDIVPAIREEYPNKEVFIVIRSTEAPSVIFATENGGTAKITMKSDAEIYIVDSNEKVGTVSIDMIVLVSVHSENGRVKGTAEINKLKLIDKEHSLGLPQDALDNLANLGKEMLAKVANDTFSKGIKVEIPMSNLPVEFSNLQFQIIDHAIYFASDISVPETVLKELGIKKVCNRRQ